MINRSEFIENFKEQFIEPEVISVNENTEFRHIDDWDSLTGMAIQVMIADNYKVDLTVDKFKSLNTVGDIINYIDSNI